MGCEEAPLGDGIGKGSLGGAEAATRSYCGGMAEKRPQPGQGAVRNNGRDCEEVGAGRGSRRGKEVGQEGFSEEIMRWVRGSVGTGQGPQVICHKD